MILFGYTRKTISVLLTTLAFLLLLTPEAAFGCSSGDGLIPPRCGAMQNFWHKYRQYAISCTRTRGGQARLRACFAGHGRRGQAGRNSNHVAGCACDVTHNLGNYVAGVKLMHLSRHRGNHYSPNGR